MATCHLALTVIFQLDFVSSQGMTIDLLRVQLTGCFSAGQAYVACSRGRSTTTMVVDDFSEDCVITSDIVKKFYSSLRDGTEFKPPSWFSHLEKEEMMAKQYGGEKCSKCGSVCVMYKVKKQGPNHGKWVVQCKTTYGVGVETGHGHRFGFVPELRTDTMLK
jgi:hypothetical protein